MIQLNEFIRRLDGLGRIVIPKEYRKKLKISDDSKLKISIDDDHIRIEKYSDIDNNLEELEKYKKIISKSLDLEIEITDLEEKFSDKKELNETLIKKIKYGKIDVLNYHQDVLFDTDKTLSMIIVPIISFGEVIGSIIGYSYEREINEIDQKILELVKLILIKNIEE